MDLLLQIGLSNAVVATLLALVAAGVGWLGRRPALTHGLWLLVLLKLITPPLWPVEIAWPVTEEPEVVAEPAEPPALIGDDADTEEVGLALGIRVPDDEEAATEDVPVAITSSPVEVLPVAAATTPAPPAIAWQVVVLAVWLGGAGLWFAVAIWRIQQFRRLLRFAQPAPAELQTAVQRLAERLGLRRVPGAWLVPGSVSPMLWAIGGRPRLLVPAALWERLDDEQRATLLAHELAHLRRADHWVRWLEFVATGLFWWHPVVWWARREIGIAEEECCDAWVVWALPAAVRAYALALMETVDFLSEVRTVLPPAVSGIGHVQLLRRRLAMIMLGTNSRGLSGAGFLALVALGALVLPLLPTWAQEPRGGKKPVQEDKKSDERRVIILRADDEAPDKAIRVVGRLDDKELGNPVAPGTIEDARDEMELLQAQLDVKRAEMQESEARLKQAVQRLERIQHLAARGAVSEGELAKSRDDVELAKAQLEPKRAQIREAELRLAHAKRRLERLHQAGQGQLKVRAVNEVGAPATPARKGSGNDPNRQKVEDELKKLLGDEAGKLSPEARKRLLERLQGHLELQIQGQRSKAETQKALAEMKAREAAEKMKAKAKEQDLKYKKRAEDASQRAKDAALKAQKALEAQLLEKQLKADELLKAKITAGDMKKQSSTDAQLQDLQKKVDALAREMEALRKELRGLMKPQPDQPKPEAKRFELRNVPQDPVQRYEVVPVPDGRGGNRFVPKPSQDPRDVPAVPLTPAKPKNGEQ